MPSLEIASWSAWSPSSVSFDSVLEYGSVPEYSEELPDISFISSKVKRRCSPVSKMMLWTAFQCADAETLSQLPTVFATQGGESEITLALLREIARGEVTSPMKFSLSVHNASAGLFSMAAGNTARSTTISAGNHTLAAGLFEAWTQLNTDPEVLLVYGDEWLPEVLRNDYIPMAFQFSLSLLLRRGGGIDVSYRSLDRELSDQSLPQPFEFVKWLSGERKGSHTLEAPYFELELRPE